MIEIQWLDDDLPPRTANPRAPSIPAHQELRRRQEPPQVGSGSSWFICENEGCRTCGHVATGSTDPVHHHKRGRCRDCGGLGIDPVVEGACEHCQGKGYIILKEWDEPRVHRCPNCGVPMNPLRDDSPHRYPRMVSPEVPDREMRGDVAFGRTRIVE